MALIKFEDLLDTGAHFGHVTRKWHPNYKPYVLMEKNGVHIINLDETIRNLNKALDFISSKAKNKAIREELDHQIAQAMQKLETELTTVITSLKDAYSKTSMRRNEVRARLVTIAKATSSESKSDPRFQLLEKREREVLSLRERYESTLSKWQEAKLLVTLDDRQKESP